jgi:hypothetical protein
MNLQKYDHLNQQNQVTGGVSWLIHLLSFSWKKFIYSVQITGLRNLQGTNPKSQAANL